MRLVLISDTRHTGIDMPPGDVNPPIVVEVEEP